MWEALRNNYFVVTVDDELQLVVLKRTAEPFPTVHVALAEWDLINVSLDKIGRKGRCLLADLRQGPARNDPGFEQAMRKVVAKIHHGYVRNAVLVRLAAGALQIRRHAREDGIERLVTDSEEAAFAYLRDGGTGAAGRR